MAGMGLIELTPIQSTLCVYALVFCAFIFLGGMLVALIVAARNKKYPHICEVTERRRDGRNRIIQDRYRVYKDVDTRTGEPISVFILATRKTKIRIQKPETDMFDVIGKRSDYARLVILPSGEAYVYKPNFDKVSDKIDFDVSNRDALTMHVNEYKKIDEKWQWKNNFQQLLMLISPFILMVMLILGGFYLNKMTKEGQDAAASVAASNAEVAKATRDVANMTVQIYNRMPGTSNNPIVLPSSVTGANP